MVVDHDHGGLSPGVVGAIVIGSFFGLLLLILLCVCCFRIFRRRPYYGGGSDSSSETDHRRPGRRPPRRVIVIQPYPNRPQANLTFVGGGNYPGTRVMVTKSQKIFIRPSPVARVRTEQRTVRRTDKVEIVNR